MKNPPQGYLCEGACVNPASIQHCNNPVVVRWIQRRRPGFHFLEFLSIIHAQQVKRVRKEY